MRFGLILSLFLVFFLSLPVQVFAADRDFNPYSVGEEAFEDDFDDFDDDFADEDPLISDPLEPFNRGIFWFNDKLYFYLLKPVARGYRVVPSPIRTGVDNFFSNLSTPVRAVNTLFQCKFKDTGTELGRFTVNTVIGWAGLFDPAAHSLGWEKKPEDFGQTLGHYGVGSGWYLVLPFFGPSSVRDGAGKVVDMFLDPLRYMDMKDREYYGLKVFKQVNALSLDPDTYEGIKRDALDPYLFIRAAYAQHRLANVNK